MIMTTPFPLPSQNQQPKKTTKKPTNNPYP